MVSFFKPWRRKIGGITLVLACVFAGGWVRSLIIDDKLVRFSGVPVFTEVESTSGYILWWSSSKSYFAENSSRLFWSDLPVQANGFDLKDYDNQTPWLLRQIGFGVAHVHNLRSGNNRIVWAIPYWSITVPLTLLSAWLLLSKPRESKSETPIEATPETVG